MLHKLNVHHKKDKDRYVEIDDRPEIMIYDSIQGSSLDLDVASAHPFSKDILFQAAKKKGKRKGKKKKNESELLPAVRHLHLSLLFYVLPVSLLLSLPGFLHFGRWE